MAELLGKQRILIVEDDWVVAQDMSDMIEELGGAVVGPANQLAQGLALAESEELGGAMLDVNLNGGNTFALADRLWADDVPVIFATGYDMLPERFAYVPRLPKPFTALAVEKTFRRIFANDQLGSREAWREEDSAAALKELIAGHFTAAMENKNAALRLKCSCGRRKSSAAGAPSSLGEPGYESTGGAAAL